MCLIVIPIYIIIGLVIGAFITRGNEFKNKGDWMLRSILILMSGLVGLLLWMLVYSIINLFELI